VRSGRPDIRSLPLGRLAIGAYLACAVAVGVLPSATSLTHAQIASALAFSPADLLAGEVWRLPLSGLVVDGDTWSQLTDLVPVVLLLVLLADSRTFWRAAIAGHVGSTLVAYGIVGALALTDPAALGEVVSGNDYGISCVWAGCLGALATVAARRGSRPVASAALFAACMLPALRLVSPGLVSSSGTLQLATLEHALAFAIGALAAAAPLRRSAPAAPRRPALQRAAAS
jgi:putative copper export protein